MSGITSNTPNRLLYNLAGALSVNSVAMGAYEEGDVTLEFEFEHDAPQFGGAWGILENTEMITKANTKLSIRMKEAHYAALQIYLGDLGYSSDANSETFGNTNYASTPFRKTVQNVVFTGAVRGGAAGTKNIVLTLSRAVITPPPLTFPGKGSAGFDVVFEGRYTTAAPGTFPVKIEIAV